MVLGGEERVGRGCLRSLHPSERQGLFNQQGAVGKMDNPPLSRQHSVIFVFTPGAFVHHYGSGDAWESGWEKLALKITRNNAAAPESPEKRCGCCGESFLVLSFAGKWVRQAWLGGVVTCVGTLIMGTGWKVFSSGRSKLYDNRLSGAFFS